MEISPRRATPADRRRCQRSAAGHALIRLHVLPPLQRIVPRGPPIELRIPAAPDHDAIGVAAAGVQLSQPELGRNKRIAQFLVALAVLKPQEHVHRLAITARLDDVSYGLGLPLVWVVLVG